MTLLSGAFEVRMIKYAYQGLQPLCESNEGAHSVIGAVPAERALRQGVSLAAYLTTSTGGELVHRGLLFPRQHIVRSIS